MLASLKPFVLFLGEHLEIIGLTIVVAITIYTIHTINKINTTGTAIEKVACKRATDTTFLASISLAAFLGGAIIVLSLLNPIFNSFGLGSIQSANVNESLSTSTLLMCIFYHAAHEFYKKNTTKNANYIESIFGTTIKKKRNRLKSILFIKDVPLLVHLFLERISLHANFFP